ncbi:MAG: MarR family transcriptional regulator [Bacteroidia bacterium]|nr:MarR family transcriptional regulator [Bacteroidia bacterium]
MELLKRYIKNILGIDLQVETLSMRDLDRLPIFMGQRYLLYIAILLGREIVMVEYRDSEDFSILNTEKHFLLLKQTFHKNVVLIIPQIASHNRKRLIQKGISFIVPGKQLYLPVLLMDIRETYEHPKGRNKPEKLVPSAQALIIYYILHRNKEWKFEDMPFKYLAKKLGYTPMTITKAIENLKHFEIVDVVGEKEKSIRFKQNIPDLWRDIENRKLWVTPVIKQVFIDKKPENIFLLHSNTSALPLYSRMNPTRQEFYAIEKQKFYELAKGHLLANINDSEGLYCLEVWKYNPLTLIEHLQRKHPVVDPLSLYLSLKESKDERIETALEEIIRDFIW